MPFTCPKCGRTSYHPMDESAGYCGACHEYTGHWVRFRLYIGGELSDDNQIVLGTNPGTWGRAETDPISEMAARHANLIRLAEGTPYLMDVEFWDGEHVRWGDDPAGMVEPVTFTDGVAGLLLALARRWGLA